MCYRKISCACGYIQVYDILTVHNIYDSSQACLEGPTGLFCLYTENGTLCAVCVLDCVWNSRVRNVGLEAANQNALCAGSDRIQECEYGQEFSHYTY